jgi:DNA-binding SARP family transcriptional activator/TolB-like protein/Tfp pilus assembly protein PilF
MVEELPGLRLRLLGGAELASEAGPRPARLSTTKGIALLAYLAMNGGRPASRSVLADLLWGDRIDRQARQNLRQCLMTVRRDLGAAADRLLAVDDRSITLNADAIEVDALRFMAAANAAEPAERLRCLEIPWGPFLAGFHAGAEAFEEWAAGERSRLAAVAVRTFSELAEACDAAGDGARAILAMERLVSIEPAEEERHRWLLSLEARYHGPDAALARASGLVATLRRELDAAPEPATLALIEEIRRGAVRAHSTAARPGAGLAAAAPQERAAPPPAAQPPRRGWAIPQSTRGRVALAVAAAAAVLALAVPVLLGGRASPPPVADARHVTPADRAPSWHSPPLSSQQAADASSGRGGGVVAIAVLPFTGHGEAVEPANLAADMMTDDLTNILSRVGGFRVISRQTSNSYRGQRVDAAALGAELGVRYLVEGSVQMRGDNLRVNAELVETRTRLQVWSGRFERAGADRHRIQDEIVNSLGRALQISVTRIEGEQVSKDPDVHELVFRGWGAMAGAAQGGVAALRQAEAYFAKALEHEPDNPRAQTGLGAFHASMAAQLFAPDPAPHLARAETLLRRVIDRHPSIDGPHVPLGLLLLASGRRQEAGRWFERAIELNPSQAAAYAQLGRVLVGMSRAEEGLEHILYATRLSPRDPSIGYWLGFAGAAELELGRYDQAIAYLNRALALNPGQPRTILTLVAGHALAGNMREAGQKLQHLQERLPHLSDEKLIARFFGSQAQSPPQRLLEGLRLALTHASH